MTENEFYPSIIRISFPIIRENEDMLKKSVVKLHVADSLSFRLFWHKFAIYYVQLQKTWYPYQRVLYLKLLYPRSKLPEVIPWSFFAFSENIFDIAEESRIY